MASQHTAEFRQEAVRVTLTSGLSRKQVVIFLEVLGGLAIIVGWQTRWVALALAGFCVLSALIFHNNFADQNEMANFMKNIAIAGGFLFLFANGAGAWSLDNRSQLISLPLLNAQYVIISVC